MKKFAKVSQISCEVSGVSFVGLIRLFDEDKTGFGNLIAHSHMNYELLVFCDGKYVMETLDGKSRLELRRGDTALIEPQCKHFTKKVEKSNHKRYTIQIRMIPSKLEGSKGAEIKNRIERRLRDENGMLKLDLPNAVWLIEQIYESNDNSDVTGKLIKNAYFKLLMTELLITAGGMDDSSDAQLENLNIEMFVAYDIERYIHDNFQNHRLSIQMVSDWLHIGERQITRILTKQNGQTFSRILREQRLAQAKLLLRDTDLSIESIANRVGYDTVVGLHSAFKKQFGITPGEYRKNDKD